jgi:hypothetical protein
MLKNFPPKNAKLFDLKDFEMNSDFLLKPRSSSEKEEPQPPKIASSPYDSSILSNLTNLSQELTNNLTAAVELPDDTTSGQDNENENTSNDVKNSAKSGKTDSDSILAMIFKIVPIGVKIAKKGKTIATGFKRLGNGLKNLIANAGLLAALFTMDTIVFFIQLFVYLFKLLLCTVTIISNFPKCVIFYVINIFMLFILCCILSILFMLDVFLMVKYFAGISCVESFMLLLQYMEMLDQFLYSTFSFHIIHYPVSILNMCYRCSVMGDTSGFQTALSRVFNDIFVNLPNEIGGPIGETLTGIGNILSFLDLS